MIHSRNRSTGVNPRATSAKILKIKHETAAAGILKSDVSAESVKPTEQPLILSQERRHVVLSGSQKRVKLDKEEHKHELGDLQANAGEARQRLVDAVESEEKQGDSEVDQTEKGKWVISNGHIKVHDDPIHTTEIGKDFSEEVLGMTQEEAMKIARTVVWLNVVFIVSLHLGGLYGIYLGLTRASWQTIIWGTTCMVSCSFGVSGGAHRLWSHRSYKARLPLQIFLLIIHTIAGQNHLMEWARDHRVHHKFSETDADPHNARRGFFFAHMGWLMLKKHPAVKIRGRTVDISDLENDRLLRLHRRFYMPLVLFFNYTFPALVAKYAWGESFWVGFWTCSILRYCCVLHATWAVNSFAHMYGNRPYDRFINPRDCFLTNLTTMGDGYHNFHHTFPFDYRSSEWYWNFNPTTFLLDAFAAVGLVYDRKTVGDQAIKARKAKTGE